MRRTKYSIYALKPGFQNLLRPLARILARAGVQANQMTILACAVSVLTGVLITARIQSPEVLLILPVVLLLRMAMNALDGMLAIEFGQKSALGAYLNELGDVISDAFLYLPFAFLPYFDPLWIGAVIVCAVISEMAGMIGGGRRYDGPMGKSDRAVAFGVMALWIGFGGNVLKWVAWLFPRLLLVLLAITIVNRVRHGLRR
jgi:CDP-diacylglycerol--glycerol-3-phosphate 3-phosphatidyltransferase